MSYVIKKTKVWGDSWRVKSPKNKIRLMKKNKILGYYPFIDHLEDGGIYAYKPINQKGPAKENQTFIISYAYNYDKWINIKEQEFINILSSIDLLFYKEKCIFRNEDSYKIIIYEKEIDLDSILNILNKNKN